MSVLLLLLLTAAGLCLTAMATAYGTLSTPHLRHWGRKKDPTATKLYPLKAQGSATMLTIELLRALIISAALILLAHMVPTLIAWAFASTAFFVAFIVLTQLYLKQFGLRALTFFSSGLLFLTRLLKPITLPLGRIFDRFLDEEPVTLTKADLSKLITEVEPEDTDISTDELRILKHALNFSDKTVHDVMTPRSVMTAVKVNDTLSPVVLDELHKSGHSRFPVLNEDGKEMVGILYLHDMMKMKSHALVKEVMRSKVYFVHEDRELDDVLQAFLKTKQHLFVVVNSFAEAVGLITIEDVIEQILGKLIIDEFDRYDDMREVAARAAKSHRKQNKENMVE